MAMRMASRHGRPHGSEAGEEVCEIEHCPPRSTPTQVNRRGGAAESCGVCARARAVWEGWQAGGRAGGGGEGREEVLQGVLRRGGSCFVGDDKT